MFLNDDEPHLKHTILPPNDLSETRSELPQFIQTLVQIRHQVQHYRPASRAITSKTPEPNDHADTIDEIMWSTLTVSAEGLIKFMYKRGSGYPSIVLTIDELDELIRCLWSSKEIKEHYDWVVQRT